MGTDVITVRGLEKRYGSHRAVDGLDLDVRGGEVFAILGPNGAGKTTTTEILEGFRIADAGEVRVLGTDPARAGIDWRRRIGIVLQQSGDLADLSVTESLSHFAQYFPRPRSVDDVIEQTGLGEKRKARVGSLSGGQRRRLDVALGILGNPEVLFLDEPTTGFDPEARRQFWELIRDLRSEGTTILLTTHYLDEAENLADRVGVVAAGRLVDVNTPDRLGGRHQAMATVSWLGADGPQQVQHATPAVLVAELAERYGPDVPELTITRPSLEDIYLDMIGAQP